MMSIASLGVFVVASLALLITPGPAVLYIVARSVDQGRKAGLVSVLGIQTGTLFHVAAAAFGVSAILMSSALAFQIVKYLGAAYLIYLGIRKLTTKEAVQDTATVEQKSLHRIYTQGVIVNVLNPKTALFFFSFLPQFIDPNTGPVTAQILFLGILFTLIAFCTDGLYAVAAGTAGRWLRGSRRFLSVQRYVTGTVYIGLGITAALASGERK